MSQKTAPTPYYMHLSSPLYGSITNAHLVENGWITIPIHVKKQYLCKIELNITESLEKSLSCGFVVLEHFKHA
jgi:hypothetical protein